MSSVRPRKIPEPYPEPYPEEPGSAALPQVYESSALPATSDNGEDDEGSWVDDGSPKPSVFPIAESSAPPSHDQQRNSSASLLWEQADTADASNLAMPSEVLDLSQGHIRTRDPSKSWEEFDRHYKVHQTREFKWGRVFKVLWSEPSGDGGSGGLGPGTFTDGSRDPKGHFQKVRRFVIIDPKEGHCICLPINTYGRQGVNKRGVHANHHAIVYSGKKPVYFRGEKEKGLTKESIKINCGARHELDESSRLNYAKPYTVEYNVKVSFIGQVDPGSEWLLITDYNNEHPLQVRGVPPRVEAGGGGDGAEDLDGKKNWVQAGSSYVPENAEHTGSATAGVRQYQVQGEEREEGSEDLYGTVSPPGEGASAIQGRYDAKSQFRNDDDDNDDDSDDNDDDDNNQDYDDNDDMNSLPNISLLQPSSRGQGRPSPLNAAVVKKSLPLQVEPVMCKTKVLSRSSLTGSQHSFSAMSDSDSSLSRSQFSEFSDSSLSISQFSEFSNPSSLGSSTYDGGQNLMSFLMGNRVLQTLIRQSFAKFGPTEFENKLRSCLWKFSKHVRLEAASTGSSNMAQAGKIVQAVSRSTARSITENFTMEAPDVTFSPDINQPTAIVAPGTIDVAEDEGAGTGSEESGDENRENTKVDDEVVEQDILPALMEDMRASQAYQHLLENLGLILEPDHARRALFVIWPLLHDRSTVLKIDCGIEWEAPSYLEKYFPPGTKLGKLLTLSGSSIDAQAQSCEDYLFEKWPQIGRLLLRALEEFLRRGMPVTNANDMVELKIVEESGLKLLGAMSRLKISVTAAHPSHVQVLTALSWLCSAVRSSDHAEVKYSTMSIRKPKQQRDTPSLTLKMRDLEPISRQESCWHALFPHCVIAKGFPITERSEGIGLEVSFSDMALVSGALTFVQYDQGFIAHGLTSVLIPMAELSQDNAFQWHFEDKTKQPNCKLSSVPEILGLDKFRSWHQELSPDELVSRRCFLGWAESAKVIIGTKDYKFDLDNLNWSGADDSPDHAVIRSVNITAAHPVPGVGTVSATMVRTVAAVPNFIAAKRQRDLETLIATSDDHLVLIYDNGLEIGWYVPQACVVLQMAHYRLELGGLFLDDQAVGNDNFDGFAEACLEGGSKAKVALTQCCQLKIRKDSSPDAPNTDPKTFAVIIESVWHDLNNVREKMMEYRRDFGRTNKPVPQYLRGIEIREFANMANPQPIKIVNVGKPWVHLTSVQPTVLLSSNIKAPIVPTCTNICKSWAEVPPHHKYLVAMRSSVNSFLSRRKLGIAENLDWTLERGETILKRHSPTIAGAIRHSQKLSTKDVPSPNHPIVTAMNSRSHRCGALIFGDGSDEKCSDTIPEKGASNTIQGDHPAVHISRPSTRPSSEYSAYSARQGEDLSASSLGSSTESTAHPLRMANMDGAPLNIYTDPSQSPTEIRTANDRQQKVSDASVDVPKKGIACPPQLALRPQFAPTTLHDTRTSGSSVSITALHQVAQRAGVPMILRRSGKSKR